MACEISFQDQLVPLNNIQFRALIDHAIDTGRSIAISEFEQAAVDRMIELNDKLFFPGRGIQIEDDFPGLEEQKFWGRAFFDTARAIFDRRVGEHKHSFWQAQRIWQAYGVGQLFVAAVRLKERGWVAESLDHREFDLVVNKRGEAGV